MSNPIYGKNITNLLFCFIQIREKMSSSPVPNPVLTETQINLIAQSAARLVPSLPYFEAKRLSLKKDINREIYVSSHKEYIYRIQLNYHTVHL